MSLSQSPRRKHRSPVSLSHKLDHKLLGYAAAASAAGVGILALAQPTEAEIVYTPTHQLVTKHRAVSIDLNHDGITDFTLRNLYEVCFETTQGRRRNECSEFTDQSLLMYGNGPNFVMGGTLFASALPLGKRVGPGDTFRSREVLEFCSTQNGTFQRSSGPWRNVKNLYVGLTFGVNGQTYYGWARLSVTVNKTTCNAQVLLTGYAYEDTPEKAIPTGKTSGTDEASAAERPEPTLGALAAGSAGLVAWRRDEDAD
jgi:hypothetical protein